MRPIVLAGIVAALAGCSLPYQGKKFAAMPKPHHMADGEHREVGDPTDNNEQSGAVYMQAHGTGRSGAGMYSPDADDNFSESGGYKGKTRPLGWTPMVFPPTVQPTGDPTMNPTENKYAPQPSGVAEESGHESVQGQSEHHDEAEHQGH